MSIEDVTRDPALEGATPQAPSWTHVVVHHTGAEEKNAQQVRDYHLRLGFRDVGYHYLIEQSGLVVDGRPVTWPGAHCTADGMNHKALGVALLGNLEKREPYPNQVESLQSLLVRLMAKWRIPVINILGHGDVKGAATVCPGRLFARGLLKPLRLEVNGRVVDLSVRLVPPGRSEMLVEEQWVPIAAVARRWGGSARWSGPQNAVIVNL